jgi:hypothetical protein
LNSLRQAFTKNRGNASDPGTVAAPIVTLGDPVGDTLPVPTLAQAQDVGWYQFTALPGTPGNAVVVGHGDFDYATRHYLDNLIVSAVWQPVNTRKRPVVCNNCHRESATIKRGSSTCAR